MNAEDAKPNARVPEAEEAERRRVPREIIRLLARRLAAAASVEPSNGPADQSNPEFQA